MERGAGFLSQLYKLGMVAGHLNAYFLLAEKSAASTKKMAGFETSVGSKSGIGALSLSRILVY
jgi:hypothetical protein